MTLTFRHTVLSAAAFAALATFGCSEATTDSAAAPALETSPSDADDADQQGKADGASPAETTDDRALPTGELHIPSSTPAVVGEMPSPRNTNVANLVDGLFIEAEPVDGALSIRARWPFTGAEAWQLDYVTANRSTCSTEVEIDGRRHLLLGPGQMAGGGDGPSGSFDTGDGELTDTFVYQLVDLRVGEMVWSGEFVESQRQPGCPSEVFVSSGMLRIDERIYRLDRDDDNLVKELEHAQVYPDGLWALVGDYFVNIEIGPPERDTRRELIITDQDGATRSVELSTRSAGQEHTWSVDDRYALIWTRESAGGLDNRMSFVVVDVVSGEVVATNEGDDVPCCTTPRNVSPISAGGLVPFDGQYLELSTAQFRDAPPGTPAGDYTIGGEWLYRSEGSSDTFRVTFSRGVGTDPVVYEGSGGDQMSVSIVQGDVAIIGSGSYLYALDLAAPDELWALDIEELKDGWQVRSTGPVVATPGGLMVAVWAQTPETGDNHRGLWLLLDDR